MLYWSRAPICKCCLYVDSHRPLHYFGSVPTCPVTVTVPHYLIPACGLVSDVLKDSTYFSASYQFRDPVGESLFYLKLSSE